jgi:capsular exopolysaccharide synthesis family protein
MTVPHTPQSQQTTRSSDAANGIPFAVRGDEPGLHDLDNLPANAAERNLVQDARHALRRRWPLALLAGAIVGSVIAAVHWLNASQQYTATAVLRVSAGESRLLDTNRGGRAQTTFEVYKRTQRQYVRNPAMLAAALQRQSVAQLPLVTRQVDPVAWLQQLVNVMFPDDAELMYVSVKCEDGATAEALVAAIVEVYVDDAAVADRRLKMSRVADLERVLAETETSLRKKRADLRQLVDTLGGGEGESMTLDQRNAVQEFSTLWGQLTQVELDLKNVELWRKSRADGKPGTADNVTVSDDDMAVAAVSDRTMMAYKFELERIRAREDSTRSRMSGGELENILKTLESRRQVVLKKIEDRKKELKELVTHQKRAAAETNVQNLINSENMLKTRRSALAERVDFLRKEAAKLGRSSIDVELMRAEVKGLEEMRSQVQRELHESNVEVTSAKSRIAILSPATVSKEDDRQRRATSSMTYGGLSCFATGALVVLWDLRRRRLNTALEVTNALHLPVLGTIPILRRHRRLDQNSHGLGDAVDGIAASLVFSTPEESQRVVLVTSALPGEGKTTVAANLATSLAALGRPTLLLDLDLRRPRLHTMFNVELAPGATEVLAGQIEPLDAVRPTDIENLSVLPAGALHERGLSARYDDRVKEVLGELRTAFAHVVVDTGPVLPIVETRLLARHVDGVVVSLLRDVSEIPKVMAACELLRSFEAHILGAVMIGTPGELYYNRIASEEPEAA